MTRITGNDIVALDAIDRMRTREPRFYSKILSGGEKELFCRTKGMGLVFDEFVWLAWSVKESAYKCLKRNRPALLFFPTKCIVEQVCYGSAGSCRGRAVWGSQVLYFRSVIHPRYLSTVVSEKEEFVDHYWATARIGLSSYAAQSAAVRELVLKQLGAVYPGMSWRIIKDRAGCPMAVAEDAGTEIPVSLAHHGHYIAYSFVSEGPNPGVISTPVFI
ncbi:MAG: 4'-phosphopantetheinyl transferase superfamily protein [Bacteroidota bacterium]|nr:4'-phosphopantetheinyl transferase superfamily protein [Bacteroidota bacterium]MDP4216224.1 4'-phosphopantetheinyl transferase superfamily protein [Bacteroidota bacterium]MDP4245117.1 4'-phosphopantetheinyl transferase superfamily protein [Bacteroidota bacterium]MDP4253335.1 4'-phosphopantetheinyl transferase superfamily protein [Bacteroidota bacterium]MDP4256778.1 4'-phosphopantetheinyl transferase superfamily protein [Bacteroidota bacterium]